MRLQSRPSRSTRRQTTVGSAVAAALVVVAGCGGEEKAAKAVPFPITVTKSGKRLNYSSPRRVSAGLVRMTLTNKTKKPRKAQLWRILDDHSVKAALAVQKRRGSHGYRTPMPEWLTRAGGVGYARRGKTSFGIQRLGPGRYYIAGSGGDRARTASFVVVGKESDADLPDADGSIVYREYNFTTEGLRAGTNLVEIDNQGLEPHHTVFAPVKRGRSVRQLRQFLRGRATIPVGKIAELKGAEETPVIEEGQKQVVPVRLKPGKYALLCFVTDRRGGDSHVVKGMVDELTVR